MYINGCYGVLARNMHATKVTRLTNGWRTYMQVAYAHILLGIDIKIVHV
jgi:hypothetical protein